MSLDATGIRDLARELNSSAVYVETFAVGNNMNETVIPVMSYAIADF